MLYMATILTLSTEANGRDGRILDKYCAIENCLNVKLEVIAVELLPKLEVQAHCRVS
jgi:hypothetical protein